MLFATATGTIAENTVYDVATGIVTIPAVEINNKIELINVQLKLNPAGTFSFVSAQTPPPSDPLACSNYAAGTDYCTDGKYPTCEVSSDQANQISEGMTYQEVIQIFGCHGVLSARNGAVAVYVWGSESFVSHAVTFYDGKVNSVP